MIYLIKPDQWGPWAWHLMHTISIGDNKEINSNDKLIYKKIYTLFLDIIPCLVCKKHYGEILEKNNIKLSELNRKYIIKWVINVHNLVNKQLKKRKISNSEGYNAHRRIDNKTNFKFLNAVFKNLNKNLSFDEVNNYKMFIICLAKIYPDKRYRDKLLEYTNKTKFKNISTSKDLMNWYTKYYMKWQY